MEIIKILKIYMIRLMIMNLNNKLVIYTKIEI